MVRFYLPPSRTHISLGALKDLLPRLFQVTNWKNVSVAGQVDGLKLGGNGYGLGGKIYLLGSYKI